MAEVREVDIVMIQIDPEIQPRVRLFQKPLKVLTQLLQEDGAEAIPPVVLFHDPDDVYWLADGHYRVTAAKEALSNGGPRILLAEVHEGTKRDAFFYAAGANKHGTHLTDAEKRRVVKRLLLDDVWGQMSDSAIARHVGVSNGFVSGIHRELDSQQAALHQTKIAPETRTVTYRRGGKEIRMKKGNIGRGTREKAKTAPTTTPPDSPAITQYERPIDEDEAPQIDDSREVVESGTTMSITPWDDSWTSDRHAQTGDPLRENDEYPEDFTTEGFKYLQVAWEAATDDDRYAVLKWIKTDQDQKRWHEAAGAALESFTLTRAPLR